MFRVPEFATRLVPGSGGSSYEALIFDPIITRTDRLHFESGDVFGGSTWLC